ncbi:MAG TPA: NAD(P)-dependent oxidoreductase, partial [Polyangiaceae bacterium]|nr:NAD(P)-dependent oxidoreductase [Polyangiaceae bacterium]
ASAHGVAAVSKEDLFARADVLSVHLILSERSRGLVGATELARMKRTALLVNTSRGPIVDEAALLNALRGKEIAGAALDVYDIEPLPADHPLRALENAMLTPHLGYVTREMYEIFYGDAVENIAAYQAGKPIRIME